MNLKTGGILLIVFSLIYLSSDDAYARRIKTNDSKERSIEYGHTFIFDAIKKGDLPSVFSRQDIIHLTGEPYQSVHYYTNLLVGVGVLEVVQESKLTPQEGRTPTMYQLNPPFNIRRNLELLTGIPEMERAYTKQELTEVCPIIKRKFEALSRAVQSLHISVDSLFKEQEFKIKEQLLINMSYYGMLDFFESFSSIHIQEGSSHGLDLSSGNDLIITFPSIDDFISQQTYNNFQHYAIQVESVAYSIVTRDAELEGLLLPFFKDIGLEPPENKAVSSASERINLFISRAVGMYRGALFLEHMSYDPSLFESFVNHRDDEAVQPLYEQFVMCEIAMTHYILNAIRSLPEEQAKILVLRDLYRLPLKEVAVQFDIKKEDVRRIEMEAWDELRRSDLVNRLDSIVQRAEEISIEALKILGLYREDYPI
ncbi:MAG: sigma factor-like helix-turn-helix DNA-binding protein [Candidatus Kaelpia imicola]|nr:sigma factor-like helix-turn-helix DNA-binding protein [Candidatus Kaelpia imicola]